MVNPMQINAAYLTDQGRVREHNEDFVILRQPDNSDDAQVNGWVGIVADGVGGAEAGEVASQYASEQAITHYLHDHDNGEVVKANQPDWGARLKEAVMAAHFDLCNLIETRQKDVNQHTRMGTTLVAAVVNNNTAVFVNVGDSRGYHLQNNEIRQVTKDHSLVVKLLEEGLITQEDADTLRIGNIILQSIGSEQPPEVDLFPVTLQSGDRIMLCSDGLNNHVKDHEIGDIIEAHEPDEACRRLVRLANERGGHDNISVLVMHCL